MIYKKIKMLIERDAFNVDDLLKKIDTFYLFNRITEEEYKDLVSKLGGQKMANVYVNKKIYKVDTLYQWDKDQELVIFGLSLPSKPKIHFTNDTMEKAIVRNVEMDGAGIIRVMIPNSLMQQPYKIRVHVCVNEKTSHTFVIPMIKRNKPADYTIEVSDDEVYSFNALDARINNLVANAGDASNNAELLDIRVGRDGVIYSTAGEAVRKQFEAMDYKTTTFIAKNITNNKVWNTASIKIGNFIPSALEESDAMGYYTFSHEVRKGDILKLPNTSVYSLIATSTSDRLIVTDTNRTVIDVVLFDDLTELKQYEFTSSGYFYLSANVPNSSEAEAFYLLNYKNYILTPLKAEVGQVLVVASVDENGFPTSWKCVTLSSQEVDKK